MKVKFGKRMKRILVVAFAAICMIGYATQLDASVYAEEGQPESAVNQSALNKGSDVLKTNVNTEDAQIVWYGGQKWDLISYGDHGNKYTAKEGQMTLFSEPVLENIPYCALPQNAYLESNLHVFMNDWYDTFYRQEKDAVTPRLLDGGSSNKGTSAYDPNKIKGLPVFSNVWPLTVAMAKELPQKIRSIDGDRSTWWLCSPGVSDDSAAFVSGKGEVDETGENVQNESYARPAIDLDESKVLLTSAAVGGKQSGPLDFTALTPVGVNETNEWKLTVKDSKRDSFSVNGVHWYQFPPDDIRFLYFVYTGGVTGDNSYISGIIVNAKGEVTYYGRLDKASKSNDYIVDLKDKYNEGDTLYLFNEQVNGDNQTDWSSDLIKIDVPEKPDPTEIDPDDVKWIDFGKQNQLSYITESSDEDVIFGYKEEVGRMLYFNMGSNKLAKKILVDQDGKTYEMKDSHIGTLQKYVYAPKGSTFYMHISPDVKHALCWAYVDIFDNAESVIVTGKTVKINAKGKKLKKNYTISAKKAYDIQGITGKPAFAKIKADKSNGKFAVDAKSGRVTVKKGLKRGTYHLKVNVHFPKNEDHDTYDETATVKIIVK